MSKLTKLALLLLLLASPACGAISLTQSTSSSTASVSTANLTFSSNVANGDLIIVCTNFGNNAGGTTYAATDNKSGGSNTYTAFVVNELTVAGLNDLYCAWAIHAGSAAALQETMTVTGGGAHTLRLAIYDYHSTTGWNASPVDQHFPGQSSTATPTTGNAGALTPTVTGSLVFSVIQWSANITSPTVGGGCTEQNAGGTVGWIGGNRADGADLEGAGTSSITCSFSWTTGTGYSAIGQNFLVGTSGAPTTFPQVVKGESNEIYGGIDALLDVTGRQCCGGTDSDDIDNNRGSGVAVLSYSDTGTLLPKSCGPHLPCFGINYDSSMYDNRIQFVLHSPGGNDFCDCHLQLDDARADRNNSSGCTFWCRGLHSHTHDYLHTLAADTQ